MTCMHLTLLRWLNVAQAGNGDSVEVKPDHRNNTEEATEVLQ